MIYGQLNAELPYTSLLALHSVLCACQWASWHARWQYRARLHIAQCSLDSRYAVLSCDIGSCTPVLCVGLDVGAVLNEPPDNLVERRATKNRGWIVIRARGNRQRKV
jgi:hypothetical protein